MREMEEPCVCHEKITAVRNIIIWNNNIPEHKRVVFVPRLVL